MYWQELQNKLDAAKKKLDMANNKLAERYKQLVQLMRIFKRESNNASTTIEKIKQLGSERISFLKKKLAEQKVVLAMRIFAFLSVNTEHSSLPNRRKRRRIKIL